MQHAGTREFRDHATRYFAGDEVVAVQRHGHTIGFYIPVQAKRDEAARQAMARLGAAVEQRVEESGLNEAELIQALTASPPSPDEFSQRAQPVLRLEP